MRVPTGSRGVIGLHPRGGGSPLHLVCSWLCWPAGMHALIRHGRESVISVMTVILGVRCLGIIGFSDMTLVLTKCHICHIGGCSWCVWWCGVLMNLDVACRPCRASMFFQRVVTVSLPDRGKPLESLQFQGFYVVPPERVELSFTRARARVKQAATLQFVTFRSRAAARGVVGRHGISCVPGWVGLLVCVS